MYEAKVYNFTIAKPVLMILFIMFYFACEQPVTEIHITTPEQLNSIRNNLSAICYLEADIDLSVYLGGNSWTPIGNNINGFTGTFYGNGHIISNLYINNPTEDFQGLFGCIFGGRITGLGLFNVDITARDHIGGIVGYNEGLIADSYSTGAVSGNINAGGLVGNNDGTITGCYSTVTVYSDSSNAGGLVGENYSIITACYATGSVSGSQIGGLVGQDDNGTITDCYATGSVNGFGIVRGLVGATDVITIINCFYDTDTTGQTDTGRGVPTTTANMKLKTTFDNDDGINDWDFPNTWSIDGLINSGYPHLTNNQP